MLIKSFQANNSILYYREDESKFIIDYWNYIIEILKHFLIKHPDLNINIFFMIKKDEYDNVRKNITNTNKNLWINLNSEHTLVKQGCEWGHLTGGIKDVHGNNYLIRIDNYENLAQSDIIIDYSQPNIHNILSNSHYKDLSDKHIYIFPFMYDICTIKENRDIPILTTFVFTDTIPRRKRFIDNMKSRYIPYMNISNCFEGESNAGIDSYYKRAKIVINIRQTDFHDTCEELRVLPALMSGAIIISETPPLVETIPYHDYIIWATYDTIIDKIAEVMNNYDYYYNKIFREPKQIKLENIPDMNYNTLSSKIVEFCTK